MEWGSSFKQNDRKLYASLNLVIFLEKAAKWGKCMLSGTDDYSYPSWIPQLCCQAFFYLPQVWTLLSFVMPLYLCPFPKLCLESLLGLLWLAFLKSLRQTKNSFWAFKSVTYFHNSTYLSVFLKMHINFFKAVHVHGKRIEQYSSKWWKQFPQFFFPKAITDSTFSSLSFHSYSLLIQDFL